MSARADKPESEQTNAGTQTVMRGVKPITLRDRLAVMAAAQMTPRAGQKPATTVCLICKVGNRLT